MIHAHIFEYMRDAVYYAQCFVNEHQENVDKAVRNPIPIIRLKNGDEHHFMNNEYASRWCKGRDYMLNGYLYHSDICVGMTEGLKGGCVAFGIKEIEEPQEDEQ